MWEKRAAAKANVYYRQETWGGEGAQPFKVGDFVVADVVTRLDDGEWPEGVHERDVLMMDEKYAWKRLRASEGGHRITRTMSDSVFSRTYRSLKTGTCILEYCYGNVATM